MFVIMLVMSLEKRIEFGSCGKFTTRLRRGGRFLYVLLTGVVLGVFASGVMNALAVSMDFENRILPLFEKKCFECHGDVEEPKGGLRLDGIEMIKKGGDSGVVFVAGDADNSPILQRTSLADTHEDYMPKEGSGLNALERAFLKRWINDGGDFGEWAGIKAPEAAPAAPAAMSASTEGAPEGSTVAMVPTGTTPTPGSSPAVVPAATKQSVDFEKHVLPLLQNKCFECHKAPYQDGPRLRKPKGGLRVDAARGILQGGSDGEVVIAGNAQESSLFYRTNLSHDDDDIMPPEEDGDPLSDTEKKILSTWIDEGENFNGWIGNEEGFGAAVVATPSGPSAADLLAAQVKGASPEALRALSGTGALISQVAIGNPLLRVEYITEESKIGDEQASTIEPLAGNVTELDLSETSIADGGLEMLSKFDKLTYLDLHSTEITDATVQAIGNLQHLEYLNFYGTKVTDACLPTIFKLKKLKALYLWNTGVTEEGAEKLKTGLRDTKINL